MDRHDSIYIHMGKCWLEWRLLLSKGGRFYGTNQKEKSIAIHLRPFVSEVWPLPRTQHSRSDTYTRNQREQSHRCSLGGLGNCATLFSSLLPPLSPFLCPLPFLYRFRIFST